MFWHLNQKRLGKSTLSFGIEKFFGKKSVFYCTPYLYNHYEAESLDWCPGALLNPLAPTPCLLPQPTSTTQPIPTTPTVNPTPRCMHWVSGACIYTPSTLLNILSCVFQVTVFCGRLSTLSTSDLVHLTYFLVDHSCDRSKV